MKNELKRRRDIYNLGQSAIHFYLDTGYCVFCEADDCSDVPHEDHCNVGELAEIVVNKDRKELKNSQRKGVHEFIITKGN